MSKRWDQARSASERAQSFRKEHAAVGERLPVSVPACRVCGCHLCGCADLKHRRDVEAMRDALAKEAELKGNTCQHCEKLPRNNTRYTSTAQAHEDGWCEDIFADEFYRRCSACETSRPWAWMKRLDPEKVLKMRRENPGVWMDDLVLKALLPEGDPDK